MQTYAQTASALLSATGNFHDLLLNNSTFKYTGYYNIYVSGITQKFNYGDCGKKCL